MATETNDTGDDASANQKSFNLPSLTSSKPAGSTKDPMQSLKDIAKDDELTDEQKEWFFNYSLSRFNNRRKMAYWSLITIMSFLGFLALASVYDGASSCVAEKACHGILKSLSHVETLLSWIVTFLASIVAAYFGVASFKPSS